MRFGVRARERHPDAGPDAHAHAVEHARIGQRLGEVVRDGDQVALVGHRAVTGVLVSPQSGQYAAMTQAMLESLGHHAEQFVAGRVAQRVVDLLEAVEVDQQHPGTSGGVWFAGQPRRQSFEERSSIREPGEVVGAGVLIVGHGVAQLAQRERHATDDQAERGDGQGRHHRGIVSENGNGQHRQGHQPKHDRYQGDARRRTDRRASAPGTSSVIHRGREADEEEAHQPGLAEQAPRHVGAVDALVEKDHAADDGESDADHQENGRHVGPKTLGGEAGHQERDEHEVNDRVGEVHRRLKGPTLQVQHGLQPDDPDHRGDREPGDRAVEAHTAVDATE